VQVVAGLPLEGCTVADRFVFFVVTNYNVINGSLKKSLNLRFEDFENEYKVFDALVSERQMA
jgi:hypothetical protein